MRLPSPLRLATLALASALALAPACGDGDTGEPLVLDRPVDADGDGYPAGHDCDDTDPGRYPAAPEHCDGVDEDCDGTADNDPVDGVAAWVDADGDGWGDPDAPLAACTLPEGASAVADDCDDGDPAVNPEVDEVCGGGDEDCDGLVDSEDDSLSGTSLVMVYEDADGDGHGALGSEAFAACADGPGVSQDATDCDDEAPAIYAGAAPLDSDSLCMEDADGDGYGARSPTSGAATPGTDCDDGSAFDHPGQTEVCDGVDNDCDGDVDEGC